MRSFLQNLVKQSELMEHEFNRCQTINRQLVADLVLNIEKLNQMNDKTTSAQLENFSFNEAAPLHASNFKKSTERIKMEQSSSYIKSKDKRIQDSIEQSEIMSGLRNPGMMTLDPKA